jgi:hypothetical protein
LYVDIISILRLKQERFISAPTSNLIRVIRSVDGAALMSAAIAVGVTIQQVILLTHLTRS